MAITLNGSTGITTADIAATTLTVNAGYGSNATAYGVRAWVNFNGTGTVAIRDSENVSSITDNGTGDYTVNFSTAMPDINYVTNSFAAFNNHVGGNGCLGWYTYNLTTTSTRGVVARSYNNTVIDATHLALSIVR